MSESKFTMIPIELLVYSGRNPRTEMRGLEELAENIEQYGVLQPIVVRPKEETFEVVVGERRLRASIMAGLGEVPAIIRDITDREADELRLIENIHRDDLIDAEKGDAVYSLMGSYPEKYKSVSDVARALNKPLNTVLYWTKKSRKLSSRVRKLVAANQLAEKTAAYLLKYDHETQIKLAEVIAKHKLNERKAIAFIKLYDTNPRTNLDKLANEAKGLKKVEIEVSELPPKVKEEVERVIKERKKEVEKARRKALEKAWRAPRKRKPELKKKRTKPSPEVPLLAEDGERLEVPKQAILRTTEAIIEGLDKIEHPYQRERMVRVIPKELEKIVKRVEKAPERRERVEPKLKRLYELESEGVFLSTLWGIGERAEYAGLRDFHGNCPPQVVEQCVLRLTRKGDTVLDPMAGSGTAVDVCDLLGRKCIAYDIKPPEWRNDIIRNDSRKIPLDDDSVDMIFLHPPYWDMVYYTTDKDEDKTSDLSRASTLAEYLQMLETVLRECLRVLRPNKHLCILLGDRIKQGKFIPLCRKAANLVVEVGFTDCGYAVKFTSGATSKVVKGQMIFAELAYTENLKIDHDLMMFFRKEKTFE